MKYRLKQDIRWPGRVVPKGTVGESHGALWADVWYHFNDFNFKESDMKLYTDWFEPVPVPEITVNMDMIPMLTDAEVATTINNHLNWWTTCYKLFTVIYAFPGAPKQIRIWAVSHENEDSPKGSFKGQFYWNDARVGHAMQRLKPENIRNTIWSPMMDGSWNEADTKPLVTSI